MSINGAARERANALFNELSASLRLVQSPYQIGSNSFDLYKVDNIDDLLDDLIALSDDDIAIVDERLPYWADIWPAALGLAHHIMKTDLIGPGISVLEIGCGLGLCGIAAAHKGAQVTMTDYLPEALKLAELNALYNLDSSIRFGQMDWRKPDLTLRSQVILASDVAYERRAFEPLIGAFRALLEPGGTILLSEPRREIARPFIAELSHKGFSLTQRTWPVPFQHRESIDRRI